MLRNLLLLCLAITLSNARLDAQELINWHEDLNEARQVALQYKVPILIHFYGDNCVPCKTLEKNVFTRAEVASTMQRYFVPVHINATQDRRTAAQFGVHSWPTDVFVSPDGKVLTQGLCNQNPNTYLQNLQSVAVMNRDRNLMLAGTPQPGTPQPGSAQPGSPNAQAASAQAAQLPAGAPLGAAAPRPQATNPYAGQSTPGQPVPGQPVSQAPAAAPYGRLATTSLQQSAPGREQAPAPYTNPSSGMNPYASAATATGLAPAASAATSSSLPSPTWNGQSAHGQATSGLANAGPLSDASGMTAPPAIPGTSQDHKDVNLPQSVQWQPGSHQRPENPAAIPSAISPNRSAAAAAAANPALASAPTMPVPSKSALPSPAGAFAGGAGASARSAHDSVVNNPHFAGAARGNEGNSVDSQGPAARMVSNHASANAPAVALPKEPAAVPALSGYCPVALHTTSQWLEGQAQFAIRHRGRVYYLSSQEAAQQFLAAPDNYCPVLSGYDPLVLLRDGTLVEGSVYTGLKDATQSRIMLFSSPENKKYFQENYDRLATELDKLLKPAEPLTAAAPTNSMQR